MKVTAVEVMARQEREEVEVMARLLLVEVMAGKPAACSPLRGERRDASGERGARGERGEQDRERED